MKKFFIFLVLLFLALILQLTLAGWTRRVSIDFFLVFVIYWSYSTKKLNEAVLSGFFSGLLKDIFFFPLLGINAFSFVLVSFLVNEIEGRIYHQNIILFTMVVALASLIHSLITSIWLQVFSYLPFSSTFKTSLYPAIIYNCILCFIVFLVKEGALKKSTL